MELQGNAALGVPFAVFLNLVCIPRFARMGLAHVGATGANYLEK
jgi:hypothetical protein